MKSLVWLVAVGSLAWAGCGDDGGGAGGGGGGTGSAGSGDASGACPAPPGATILLEYTDLRVDPNDATDGSVVRGIAVEADGIYVATLDQVVKLGASPSDAPTQVMRSDTTLGLTFVDTDDGFRVGDENGWRDRTGADVAYPPAVQPIDGINAAAASVMAPNGDIFNRFDDRTDDLDPEAVHYVRRVAGAADQEVLVLNGDPELGWGRPLFWAAGAVWSTTVAERIGDPNEPEEAVRIGLDGSTNVPGYTPSGMPFVVTGSFIYYNIEADIAALDELGVWRAPVGGGTGEKVTGTFGGWEGVAAGDRVVLRDPATIAVVADQPGAVAVAIAELPVRSTIGDSCTSHGLAVKDGKVYSSMFDEAREMSMVFSYDLP